MNKLLKAAIFPIGFGVAGAGIGTAVGTAGALLINLIFVGNGGLCDAVRRIATEKGCTYFKGHAGIDGGRCDDLQLQCSTGVNPNDVWSAAENDPSVQKSTLVEWLTYGAIGGAIVGFTIGLIIGVIGIINNYCKTRSNEQQKLTPLDRSLNKTSAVALLSLGTSVENSNNHSFTDLKQEPATVSVNITNSKQKKNTIGSQLLSVFNNKNTGNELNEKLITSLGGEDNRTATV